MFMYTMHNGPKRIYFLPSSFFSKQMFCMLVSALFSSSLLSLILTPIIISFIRSYLVDSSRLMTIFILLVFETEQLHFCFLIFLVLSTNFYNSFLQAFWLFLKLETCWYFGFLAFQVTCFFLNLKGIQGKGSPFMPESCR